MEQCLQTLRESRFFSGTESPACSGEKPNKTQCYQPMFQCSGDFTPITPMKTLFYFVIEAPAAQAELLFIGGGLKPSKKPGCVWLTKPDGVAVLEVEKTRVHPSSAREFAELLIAEAKRNQSTS